MFEKYTKMLIEENTMYKLKIIMLMLQIFLQH